MAMSPAARFMEDQTMPRERTTRACYTLRASQVSALRKLARRTGVPAAESVRQALDSFLVGRVVGYVPGPLRPGPDADEADRMVSIESA